MACEYCHQKESGHERQCVQKDDMQEVYPLLDEAEMIVLASPVYYHSFSGQLQCAINRIYALDKPKCLKKAALILSSGSDHVYSGAIFEYQNSFLLYLGLQDMGMFTAYGKENGSPEKLQELYNFGNRRNIIMLKTEKLNLTQEWDKTFPKSDKVEHRKVTFVNRYGITLAADLYTPKDTEGKLAAIAVSGPFGAVKEQCAGLYAQTMAERGFLTLAFDPSFTGESGGRPRYTASPDINTEDFSAAVDFLSVQDNVDPEKIGIIGICGWGGLALNAAAIDTRIKATVASTMYDLSRTAAKGYFDSSDSEEARHQMRELYSKTRTEIYRTGDYGRVGGCLSLPVPEDAPFFVKDYSEYYKGRAYHVRSLNSNEGWNTIGPLSFMNQPILCYINEIRSAVLIVHGEKAHSCYMGKDAYAAMMEGNPNPENKELLFIPDAVHTDLYDNLEVIPFDKFETFFWGAFEK